MNFDPFNLFFEEFKYKLKKHNISCPHPDTEQLARKEWEQLNQQEKHRFLYMANRQEEAYLNFQNIITINQENSKIAKKLSKQDSKFQKYHFQINYCKTNDCESLADFIEEELYNVNKTLKVERYALTGNFGAVSLFGIQEKRQSVLIWHTLINGSLHLKSQIKHLREKILKFLTP
ncbi:unnamed protein product [Paramecium sonneborni]|uniref:Uncharacterized protein n=1 Tax=Paramecium sonneborni TaxID=65129 RepID=A0A8S1KQQ3_9CILI|nr:unnamed protein product [Paramecium sonneborni]